MMEISGNKPLSGRVKLQAGDSKINNSARGALLAGFRKVSWDGSSLVSAKPVEKLAKMWLKQGTRS